MHGLLHCDQALGGTRSFGCSLRGFASCLEDSLFEHFVLNFDGTAVILWVAFVSPNFPGMLHAADLLLLEILVHIASSLRGGLGHRNDRGI